MSQDTPSWPPLPPRGARRDKRERERDRRDGTSPWPKQPAAVAPATRPASGERTVAGSPPAPQEPKRDELRVFGLNAALAAFAARPQDLRKAWLSASRLGALRDVMAWCVAHRIGYRVVEDEDLARLTGSSHHEGVCLDMRRPREWTLPALLDRLPADAPSVLLWLDGVGNPHNLGALLRSAAHFGVAGVLLPADSTLALSGAACRVAEGGADAVPLVRLPPAAEAIAALHAAGFSLAATVPRAGHSLFETTLPARTVFVLGAEREGMQPELIDGCDLRLTIPGSGKVESLNIASAVAVLLTAWTMGHAGAGGRDSPIAG